MKEPKHTISDLYQMQSLPLSAKIRMTENRIREWVDEFGQDGVYVSFSGGKDSTVLLDLVTNVCGYKRVPAVFVDVPTQYPELKQFAIDFCVNNGIELEILNPKISFMQVCEKYGFPIISKEVSESVYGAKRYLKQILDEMNNTSKIVTDRQTDRQYKYKYFYEKVTGTGKYSKFSDSPSNADIIEKEHLSAIRGGTDTSISTKSVTFLEQLDRANILNPKTRGGTIESIAESEELASLLNNKMLNRMGGNNQRLAIMLGMLTKDTKNPIKANIPSTDKSQFSQEKYKFLLEAKFDISNRCCSIMKKEPAHNYYKLTGRKPIIATMASESKLRTQKWLQNGCNGFDLKIPTSNPMSFWTEQDVLLYIELNNLPICSVYGDIVVDYDAENNVEGQMNMSELSADFGIFDLGNRPLKTTGCSRTGCVLCGFGCHLESEEESRFLRLKETHPGLYGLLDVIKNNGVTYREALEWINEHGNMNIKF